MSAYDGWIQSPYADDDSTDTEARRDAEIEAIRGDHERLVDAVYETDNDEAEKLAELRIILSDAAYAINMLTHGDSLAMAMDHPVRARAMRDLFRAVQAAELFVDARVKQAAEDEA